MIILEKIFTLEGLLSAYLAILSVFILYFIRNFSGRITTVEKTNAERLNEVFSGMLLVSKEIGNINNDMLSKFSRWEDRIKDMIMVLEGKIQKQKHDTEKMSMEIKKIKIAKKKEYDSIMNDISRIEKRLGEFENILKDTPVKNFAIMINDAVKEINILKKSLQEKSKLNDETLAKINQITRFLKKRKGR